MSPPMDAEPAPRVLDARDRRRLAWWTATAFAVRALFLWLEPDTSPIADERTWLGWAEIVLSERVGLHPLRMAMIFHPPGYPYFLAAFLGPFGSLVAVKWAQVVVSTALVPASSLIATRLFGSRVGLVAAGVVALYPELIWFSVHFWCETLLLALWWWAVERLTAADASARTSPAIAAGLLWGLAILTRETVLYLLPVAGLWLVWRREDSRRWVRAGVFVVVALAVVAPWTWRNWVKFGAFVPVSTAGGLNLYQGNAPLTRQQVYDRYYAVEGRIEMYRWARSEGIKAILDRQPWWLFEKLRDEMPRFWEADSLALIHVKRGAYGEVAPGAARVAWAVMALPFIAVVAGFGLALVAMRPDRGSILLLVLLILYNGMHVATHGFARYRLPVLPVVLLFAAWSLSRWWRAELPSLDRRRRALLAAFALVAGLTLWPSLRQNYEHPAFGFVAALPASAR